MFKRKARRSREWQKNNKVIDFEKARENRREKRKALAGKDQIAKVKGASSKRRIIRISKKRNFYTAVVIVITAVIGVSVFNVISVNSQLTQAAAEQSRLEREKEKLTNELQSVDNPDYIEYQARALLKMIKPGEIYYVVPGEEE
jgi:cell division protein FtsB